MGITAEAASGQVSDNAGKAKTGIDDAISAAFDASEDGDLSSLLESESPKGKVKVEPKETKAKTKAEPDENAGDDEAQGEDAAEPEVKAEDSEESTTLSAPKHWPEADKQAFAKMTREGQEIALKLAKNLEGGFTRKSQELSDKAKFADSVRGLFDDQTRNQLQMSLADPEVAKLRSELQALKGIIDQEQQSKLQAQNAERVNATRTLQTTIATFRQSLDEHGQLKFPHFDEVGAEMGALMAHNPELAKMPDGLEKMEKAYDMAVFARPDLRQSLIEAETQKRIQDLQKKRELSQAMSKAGL